jgi:integrase/recombinase XerD
LIIGIRNFRSGGLLMNEITVTQARDIKPQADVTQLVDLWKSHLSLLVATGELAKNSKMAYERGWDKFYCWLLEGNYNQVDGDIIRGWITAMREEGKAPNTINVMLAGVRGFFSWAVGNRHLAINPTQGVRGVGRKGTNQRHRRDILTDGEVRRVLEQPDTSTLAGKRDLAILHLMCYGGLRSVEIHRANLVDLGSSGGQPILKLRGKGSQEDDEVAVITHPEAQQSLHGWLASRDTNTEALFYSISNRAMNERLSLRSIRGIVKGYFKAAGVLGKNKSTHSLRHTAITNAIRHGAPIQKVKSMARHQSIETTTIYFHEVDRLTDPAERYISYNGE